MEDKAKEPVQQDIGGRFMSEPNTLTTSQLLREVGFLEKHFASEIAAIKEGIKISHDDMVRWPTEVQEQVGALKELLEMKIDEVEKHIGHLKELLETRIEKGTDLKEEKFKNIEKQFQLIEQARVEHKNDTANAVDKALKAAKEAVNEQNTTNNIAISKSETAMTKQMDQQSEKINQIIKTFDDKIADVKERVTYGGGKSAGYAQFIGWIIAAITIAGFIITNIK